MIKKEKLSPKIKNALFFMMLICVVGSFYYLSTLEPPPNKPRTAVHRLKFNLNGDLVGLENIQIDTHDAMGVLYKKNKKGIAAAINQKCIACHSSTNRKNEPYPCFNDPKTPCVSGTHPYKETCIKCHR